MNKKNELDTAMEGSNMEAISEATLAESQTLSTLQLWQAHLKALSIETNEPHYEVEIIDLKEQTSSTIMVNLADGQAVS